MNYLYCKTWKYSSRVCTDHCRVRGGWVRTQISYLSDTYSLPRYPTISLDTLPPFPFLDTFHMDTLSVGRNMGPGPCKEPGTRDTLLPMWTDRHLWKHNLPLRSVTIHLPSKLIPKQIVPGPIAWRKHFVDREPKVTTQWHRTQSKLSVSKLLGVCSCDLDGLRQIRRIMWRCDVNE